MSRSIEYTTLANRYTAKFPVLTYVGTQINFWILANLLLVIIIRFYGLIVEEAFQVTVVNNLRSSVLVAVILGLLYGVGLGLTGYYLDRNIFRKQPLGKVLLLKTLISITLLALLLSLLRFVFFDFISPEQAIAGATLNAKAWDYLFYLLLIYYFFMTMVISFINQVNRKYGPGVLLPLLLGRYRTPREEERIFMFMDLKSSTSTAERLGHIKYSAFIRDCFSDISEVLYPFRAQVYQYVGDAIVLMWPRAEGLRDHCCIRFYFAVQNQFQLRSDYYLSVYGFLPVFKAGLHMGVVTAVEIGEIKKDIAYHGDTMNTAARIQSVCNEYNSAFLASADVVEKIGLHSMFTFKPLGVILLKGKSVPMAVVSVERK